MTVDVTHRPTRLSGLAAVVAAFVGARAILPSVVDTSLLAVAGGVLCLVVADITRNRGHPVLGFLVGCLGAVVAIGGIGYGATQMQRFDGIFRVVSSGVGVVLVAAAVVPLRGDGSRGLVKLGTALVFLALLVAGVLQLVSLESMLTCVIALIISVDLAENAIGLGEQLGREADTLSVEAGHGVATLGVGAVATGVGRIAPDLGNGGLSLSGLVLLLAAMLALAVALYD